jgi:hypothetical protein
VTIEQIKRETDLLPVGIGSPELWADLAYAFTHVPKAVPLHPSIAKK